MQIHQISSYITYWLNVVDEHAIHSPFFFDFYMKVIKGREKTQGDKRIELLRNQAKKNSSPIKMHDLGAGNSLTKNTTLLSTIAKKALSPLRFSTFYTRILDYINAKCILELGTSIGLTTLYLANKSGAQVYTFEGNPSLTAIASAYFSSMKKHNINLIEGNINCTLPNFMKQNPILDFVLIDANHRYLPTKRYFEYMVGHMNIKGIMVIDDIYWSLEMKKIWKELIQDHRVYGSIDLYRCGILFFNPILEKKDYVFSL